MRIGCIDDDLGRVSMSQSLLLGVRCYLYIIAGLMIVSNISLGEGVG